MTKTQDYIQSESQKDPEFAKAIANEKALLNQGLNQEQAKRKLASIQTIAEIRPIKNADKIVAARVMGWDVVVKKDEFQVGDKVVFFEIDSFLPIEDQYLFMGEPTSNPIATITGGRTMGYRVHTMKMRNQISQGLVLGLNSFKNESELQTLEVGYDLTQQLNVDKYDKPEVEGSLGKMSGGFPTHIVSQTDELRMQSDQTDANALVGQSFYTSLKYDGTSVTITKEHGKVSISTRNNMLKDGSLVHELLQSTDTWEKLSAYPDDFAIQGEFYGPGIQSNRIGVSQKRFAVFNYVKNRNRQNLLDMISFATENHLELVDLKIVTGTDEDLTKIKTAIKAYNKVRQLLKQVDLEYGKAAMPMPEFKVGTFDWSIDEAVNISSELKYNQNQKRAEGMVVRTLNPFPGNEISFKVLNNKYLLKNND